MEARKKFYRIGMLLLAAALLLATSALATGDKTTVTAPEAHKLLEEGNQRFVQGKFDNIRKTDLRLKEVAKGQKPFAVIVGCSDSRVPPELLFDQGLGDLFIVRLAGNIVNDAALGSIEYAVEHLGTPLIVVMGHKRCGAVQATVEAVEKNQTVPGHLPALVNAIKPAVEQTKGQPGDRVDNAVRANIRLITNKLKTAEPIVGPAVKAGKVRVLGAYFDLDDGRVSFIQ